MLYGNMPYELYRIFISVLRVQSYRVFFNYAIAALFFSKKFTFADTTLS